MTNDRDRAARKEAARILSEVAALEALRSAKVGPALPTLPQMKAECRAHLETAKWCYDNGFDDWGDLEYYAYLDCEKR